MVEVELEAAVMLSRPLIAVASVCGVRVRVRVVMGVYK